MHVDEFTSFYFYITELLTDKDLLIYLTTYRHTNESPETHVAPPHSSFIGKYNFDD